MGSAAARMRSPSTRATLLIVDDEESIHVAYRKSLAGKPVAQQKLDTLTERLLGCSTSVTDDPTFSLCHAYGGEEGIQLAQELYDKQEPVAAAFVDMRMPPGIDGVQTVAGIWRVDPRVQVVICTAYSDFTWDRTIELLGRSDGLHLLRKPFDPFQVRRFAAVLAKKWLIRHGG